MARSPYTREEDVIALRAFLEELSVNRHDSVNIKRNLICSAGRLFLRDWRRHDANSDPDFIRTSDRVGREMIRPVHGHVDQGNGVVEDLGIKWGRRAGYYVDRYGDDLRHVRDWLHDVERLPPHWAADVGELGCPKKLLKPGSVLELRRFADREWTRMLRDEKKSQPKLTAGDVIPVMEMGEGYTLVRLATPAALDDETVAMRHCIGLGAYDWKLGPETRYAYYSVRDATGQSRATLELYGVVIQQAVGYRNGPLEDNVQEMLDDAAKALRWIDPETWEETIIQVLRDDVALRQLG